MPSRSRGQRASRGPRDTETSSGPTSEAKGARESALRSPAPTSGARGRAPVHSRRCRASRTWQSGRWHGSRARGAPRLRRSPPTRRGPASCGCPRCGIRACRRSRNSGVTTSRLVPKARAEELKRVRLGRFYAGHAQHFIPRCPGRPVRSWATITESDDPIWDCEPRDAKSLAGWGMRNGPLAGRSRRELTGETVRVSANGHRQPVLAVCGKDSGTQ